MQLRSCYRHPTRSLAAAASHVHAAIFDLDDIAQTARPTTAKIQNFGGVLGVLWDTANPRQALQGADDVDGTWTDIPGATSSPYIVPITGSKKFIRVLHR